ncbi:MAG TPA: bifunctional hydroxymethylpyrimidine kinase/phosphomethylpyrimidine kinase [Nitrospirales bacterium]|nr:bifunctional hydroxymethylpyrimidine kinase/phosphomethylpyrimidine kinase [Nitrospirales bacterium]
MSIPIAVTIAGSDSSGGAGIQADLKTFAALNVYGASVITALTAQNTREVRAIHDPPPSFVLIQLETVFADLAIRSVKTGMLSQPEVIVTVAEFLRKHATIPLVVDPVMVSKSEATLLVDEAIDVLKRQLIPLATVITPNIPEAAILLDTTVDDIERRRGTVCQQLFELGSKAVVLKGGHGKGPLSEDLFYDGQSVTSLPAPRITTTNTHGTGCTFASAIAAHLAYGKPPLPAVRGAKEYITGAIAAAQALKVGHGHGPVQHFFQQERRSSY